MRKFLGWTMLIAGAAVAGVYAVRAIVGLRDSLQDSLARAESITEHARAALDEIQRAIQETERAL